MGVYSSARVVSTLAAGRVTGEHGTGADVDLSLSLSLQAE